MRTHLRPAVVLLAVLTVLTGLAYPLAVTAVARIAFPHQANGSFVQEQGRIVGSELIGQAFVDPGYFHSRPSTAGTNGYDATASGGSNLGPTSKTLMNRIAADAQKLQAENHEKPVPVDLVTTSGSGLDPHITPAAAEFQMARVAGARKLAEEAVRDLIRKYTEPRQLGVLGEPRVNVLQLNLALDRLAPRPATRG